jgi:hypothetical protein
MVRAWVVGGACPKNAVLIKDAGVGGRVLVAS